MREGELGVEVEWADEAEGLTKKRKENNVWRASCMISQVIGLR